MLHPENKNAGGLGRRSQSSTATALDNNIRPSCKQYIARGDVYERKRIAAAFDVINDPSATLETVRAASATLEEFRRKGQFEMTPSETDFARIAAAIGFSSEQINAAWASYQRTGKFSADFAMSWQALKWADEQRAGDLSASAVLYVRASHADKNGRGFVGVPEIAEQLGTTKPTVHRADERLVKKGLLKWTKERAGQTLSIKVYQLSLPRSSNTTLLLENTKQTRSSNTTLPLRDTRARSPEPGTETTVRSPENELIVSNNNKDDKNFRPACLSRPKDAGEVWEYIYNANDDHPEQETAPLAKYFIELAGDDGDDDEGNRDIDFWLLMNERKGWRGVTDWHVYLRDTFLRGWFPSQKRKAKRRLK